jgi:hypothetical protein
LIAEEEEEEEKKEKKKKKEEEEEEVSSKVRSDLTRCLIIKLIHTTWISGGISSNSPRSDF